MHFIDSKAHIKTERKQGLFNQSYEVEITPLVIYGLGGGHTHTHTHTHAPTHTRTYTYIAT